VTTAPGAGRPVAIRSAPDRGPAPRAGRAAALPRGARMRVGLRCWPDRASSIGPGPVAAPWRTGGTGCPEACRKHDPAGPQLRLRQSSFERVLRPPASDSGCCGRSEKRQNPGAASCLPTVRPCSVTPKRALILRCRSARRKCHRVGRRIGAFAHHLRGFHRLRRVQRGVGPARRRSDSRSSASARPFGPALWHCICEPNPRELAAPFRSFRLRSCGQPPPGRARSPDAVVPPSHPLSSPPQPEARAPTCPCL